MARPRMHLLPDGRKVSRWSLAAIKHGHEINAGKLPTPPMFTLFTAPGGHGKTLSMVAYLAAQYANGFRVVSTPNLELKFGETFDYLKFLDNQYSGAIIAIDELEEYANALRYQSDEALDFVGVLIQLRHEFNEIIATTQFPGEVLSRLRRRINYEVKCYDPAWGIEQRQGKHILQRWITNPFNDLAASQVVRRQVWAADRFWNMYNTYAHNRVGSIRRAKGERKAAQELANRELVWACMWDAVVKNNQPAEHEGEAHPTISTAEVQLALAKADPPVLLTDHKIGRMLGELGSDPTRAKRGAPRRWVIKRSLFANADELEAAQLAGD